MRIGLSFCSLLCNISHTSFVENFAFLKTLQSNKNFTHLKTMMHVFLCWRTLEDSCTQKINLTKNSLALCFLVLRLLWAPSFHTLFFLVSRFVWARGSFTHMGNGLLHTKTKCKIKLVLPPILVDILILILVNFFSYVRQSQLMLFLP